MESGDIRDGQLESNAAYEDLYGPQAARLNYPYPQNTWGVAWVHDAIGFIMVNLIIPHNITALATRGSGPYYIDRIYVKYGPDRLSLVDYTDTVSRPLFEWPLVMYLWTLLTAAMPMHIYSKFYS